MSSGTKSSYPVDEPARRRFEAAWRAGRPEAIEGFLPPPGHPLYRGTLVELVLIDLEFAWKAWRAGAGTGRPAAVEAYLARFPALGEPALLFDLVREEHRLRQVHGDRPESGEYRRRFPALILTDEELGSTLAPPSPGVRRPPEVPGYEILGEVGAGGMGVVWKAWQVRLGRVVALKMILDPAQAGEEERQRFRREAEALARLTHPHIVRVHEVGEHHGLPWFAM